MPDRSGGPGGAAPVPASLDLDSPRDRRILVRSIADGWRLDEEDMQLAMNAWRKALAISHEKRDARTMLRAVECLDRLASRVQADEHLEARLAAGLDSTDRDVTIRVVTEDRRRLNGDDRHREVQDADLREGRDAPE